MSFGLVSKDHWSYPEWISMEKAAETRERMKNIIYGSSESYRHMCRYQSGFIQWHELMLQYDYYWRIEPDVKYSCDIDFDPFLYMQDNNKKYAFTISLYEYPETIHGLWNTTKGFMAEHPSLLAGNNAMNLISDDGGQTYNNCHFWSNFEIVDTRWMRGDGFQKFFQYLDRSGGFFYERWGDAPVHTIAAALLLPINEIHFFREIGYYHPAVYNCPAEPELQAKCHCDPENNANRERVSCTARFLELAGEKRMLYPEEVDD
ncbi:alpha 1,2-mannosyltransferase 2.4.1 [Entomortierella beljakovae]|nr:alpha 1,2-mannosyltransferase 2.4.1 [Entomortierella beljakovae]